MYIGYFNAFLYLYKSKTIYQIKLVSIKRRNDMTHLWIYDTDMLAIAPNASHERNFLL